MKRITKFFIVAILVIYNSSCINDASEKETFVYKSEIFNLTDSLNKKVGEITARFNNKSENIYIHSEFQTTFYISNDLSKPELENYIIENQSSINGIIKYFVNNVVFFEVEIYGGEKVRQTNYDYASIFSNFIQEDKYPDKNECSYDGIQDCVQFEVYEEWTTVETIICAVTGGFDCIAIEAAACIEKNCF